MHIKFAKDVEQPEKTRIIVDGKTIAFILEKIPPGRRIIWRHLPELWRLDQPELVEYQKRSFKTSLLVKLKIVRKKMNKTRNIAHELIDSLR